MMRELTRPSRPSPESEQPDAVDRTELSNFAIPFVVGLLLLLIAGGCGTNYGDDFGPPDGYGLVQGFVRYDAGDAASGTRVHVGFCEPLDVGESTTTDSRGWYAAEIAIPPILPSSVDADTLVISCRVTADHQSDRAVSVDIAIASLIENVTATVADVTISR